MTTVTTETTERALAAADRAREVYPGALGELVDRELRAFAAFGHRLAADDVIARLTTEILAAGART